MICKRCNSIVDDNSNFCTSCGAPIEKPLYPATPLAPQKKIGNTIFLACGAVFFALVLVIAGIFVVKNFNDDDYEDTYVEEEHEENEYYEDDESADDVVIKGQFSEDDIPQGAFIYNDHRYFIYSVDEAEAAGYSIEDFCKTKNGYLATINSESENNFLYNTAIIGGNYDHVFFGYAYDKENGEFSNLNGEKSEFTNWVNGEEPITSNVAKTTKYAMYSSGAEEPTWHFDYSYLNKQKKLSVSDIEHIEATNELYDNGTTYHVENILDGNHKTAWSEYFDDAGEGCEITIDLTKYINVSSISIWNGYHKSEDLFYKNNCVNGMTIDLNNDYTKQVNLTHDMVQEKVELGKTPLTNSITLTIDSVHRGNKYNDTLISDIEIYYTESNDYFICEWGEYEAE